MQITSETVKNDEVRLATDITDRPMPGSFDHGINIAVPAVILTFVEEERRGTVTSEWVGDFMERAQLRAEQLLRREA